MKPKGQATSRATPNNSSMLYIIGLRIQDGHTMSHPMAFYCKTEGHYPLSSALLTSRWLTKIQLYNSQLLSFVDGRINILASINLITSFCP